MVTRESIYYINLRQAYLLSPLYAHRISSRSVLFSSVPDNYANEAKIRQMYGSKLKNVWIATDTKKLAENVEERNKVAFKLEAAETKLIKMANDACLKSTKTRSGDVEGGAIAHGDISGEPGSAAARWIKPKQRPTHKLKPLIGRKVDTINWCRSELQRMVPEVEKEQSLHRSGNTKNRNTVIVEFYNQTEAQAAYQMLAHHQPLHMAPRVIGFSPQEIVWSNTGITWRTRVIRNIACIAAVVVTIIFWFVKPFPLFEYWLPSVAKRHHHFRPLIADHELTHCCLGPFQSQSLVSSQTSIT
jgi:calcium permeable stress-gated cation channel